MSLVFTINDNSLIVSGKTFHIKEKLKLFGAKWSGSAWTLPADIDSLALRQELEQAAVERHLAAVAADKAQRAFLKTPETKAAIETDILCTALKQGWACCNMAKIMDVKRQHCSCFNHGFFVNGRLRTGD